MPEVRDIAWYQKNLVAIVTLVGFLLMLCANIVQFILMIEKAKEREKNECVQDAQLELIKEILIIKAESQEELIDILTRFNETRNE